MEGLQMERSMMHVCSWSFEALKAQIPETDVEGDVTDPLLQDKIAKTNPQGFISSQHTEICMDLKECTFS